MPPKKKLIIKEGENARREKEMGGFYSTTDYLVIVESPSKCKKIETYLNGNEGTKGAKVIASKGHLYTINGLRDIDMKNGKFDIKYHLLKNKQNLVTEMRKYIKDKRYSRIVLATDDDKEGEFIAWSICDIFGLPKETTERVIFHEITESAILEAFQKPPTHINMNLVKSQQCRTVLDILIGYKISPILWKQFLNPKGETLSAGRCQTPALSLIYDNKEEIIKETPTFYYEGTLKIDNDTIFTLTPNIESPEENKESHIMDFINKETNTAHFITKGETKKHETPPPRPLNTSTLLQQASIQLRLSPNQTMQLAQQLYQSGHITYMRTESTQLSDMFKNQAFQYVIKKYGMEYTNTQHQSTHHPPLGKKGGMGGTPKNMPHEAIRCTNINTGGYLEGTDMKSKLYRLIWRYSLYSIMQNYIYNTIEYWINTNEPTKYKWRKSIEEPIFNGWKVLNKPEKTETDGNTQPQIDAFFTKQKKQNTDTSPPLVVEQIMFELITKAKKTTHYTESTLIQKLDDLGIGRPSTFHSIVETLKERGYVITANIEGTKYESTTYKKIKDQKIQKKVETKKYGVEKDKLTITELGEKTQQFLLKHYEPLFNYDYTKKMESLLDCIAEPMDELDDITPRKICDECLNEIKVCSKTINQSPLGIKAQDGEKEYEIYYSTKGPLIRNKNDKKEIYNIKKTINLDIKIMENAPMEDLIFNPYLGKYEEKDVYVKRGKYGAFIQWGEKNIALKNMIKKEVEDIRLEDVKFLLEDLENVLLKQNKKVLRIIDENTSIRKGKYGKSYIYYKTPEMETPKFVGLKGVEDWEHCPKSDIIEYLKNNCN